MKKLLLLAAILAIGTTAFGAPVRAGATWNSQDSVYGDSFKLNGESQINYETDVTTGDSAVNNVGGVNIMRDKGEGWSDQAATHIGLRVLQPIKIESEVDFLYAEAVQGDKLEIGDIGFTVTGAADARVSFEFVGMGSQSIFDLPGHATLKQLDESTFIDQPLGDTMIKDITNGFLNLPYEKKFEMDLYLDLPEDALGVYAGTIVATAKYE
jgi:hypothetical protein